MGIWQIIGIFHKLYNPRYGWTPLIQPVKMASMLVTAFALALASQQPTPAQSGSTLFHQCQANIREMDTPGGSTDSDARLAMECVDYVSGFVDAAKMSANFCFGNATVGTVTRVYVSFMQQNPPLLDEERGMGLYGALIIAYPCPVKRK